MQRVKLSDVVKRANTKEDRFNTNLIYYVGGEHIESNNVVIENRGLIKGSTIGPMFYFGFKKNDVLLVSRNPHLRKSGRVNFDGICSEKTFVMETIDENILSQDYLPFIFQSDDFWKYAEDHKSGSVNFFLNWSTLANYEFSLPSLPEQKKLAETLWSIVATMESYKKLLAKTDEMVKAEFIEMFGDVNTSKNKSKIVDGFEIRDDLRKPINDAERSSMKDGELFPYYGANGQVDSINQYLFDMTVLCIAEDCGSYGPGENTSYIVKGKAWVNNHAHVLVPKNNCDINYARAYFNVMDMRSYVSGTTRLKLTQGSLNKVPLILPPLEQQKEFANFVQKSEESKSAIQASLDSLTQVYKKIIAENLGGTN